MAPTPFDLAWTFEVLVNDVCFGDLEFEGKYLEKIVSALKDFLILQIDINKCFDDFCWCHQCKMTYIGAIIKPAPSNEPTSIFFTIGGRCFCGGSHVDEPLARELALDVELHLKTVFAEAGFSSEIKCQLVPNAFCHV